MDNDLSVAPSDQVYLDPDDAGLRAASFKTINFQGSTYDAEHAMGIMYGHTQHIATVFPRIHRTVKPRRFTKKEVRDAIASGDDSHRNVVVVDIQGKVKLLDLSDGALLQNFQRDPRLAAAYSIFQADNGYIGRKAAADGEHVKGVYLGLLHDWINHLRTGKLNRHDEDLGPLNEASLFLELEEACRDWALPRKENGAPEDEECI